MPYFIYYAVDRVGADSVRAGAREAHREHIRIDAPDCRTVAGGPMMSDDGERMIGTLLVFEAADRSAVDRFMRDDPYNRASLFERVEIRPWRWGIGQPEER